MHKLFYKWPSLKQGPHPIIPIVEWHDSSSRQTNSQVMTCSRFAANIWTSSMQNNFLLVNFRYWNLNPKLSLGFHHYGFSWKFCISLTSSLKNQRNGSDPWLTVLKNHRTTLLAKGRENLPTLVLTPLTSIELIMWQIGRITHTIFMEVVFKGS
jgi:hypothetical protein